MDRSLAALLEALRTHQLLEPEQLDELLRGDPARWPGPEALAEELVRRGWSTPYQVERILDGRGQDLVLGPYLLLRPLAQGGMGQVFMARQRFLGRVVALKVIQQQSRADPKTVERFLREMRAFARLSHPNIVTAYDANEVDDTLFLVMEYVEGVTLADLVADGVPLAVAQASDYIRQVCLGLQHAHEKDLVHRDIKPSNLLLAHKDGVVKILDLGLARLESGERPDDSGGGLTQVGNPLGTMDYIAPEQVLDPGHVDARADIYSLGCTLYHLLAGRPPFPQGNVYLKWWSHRECEPAAIESLQPELPPGLARVVRKLMAKRPEDRYQTAAEVAVALGPFCRGAGILESQGPSATTLLSFEPAQEEQDDIDPGAEDLADAGARLDRGIARLRRREFDRAVADFDAAIRLDPGNALAYTYRGYVHRKRGTFDRAIADFDEAIRLDPGLAEAYTNRGRTHHARGDYERAIADYGAAIRLDPDNAHLYNNRGYARAIQGAYDEAIADYSAAIRLDPGHIRAYFNRALAYRVRGRYRRAVADYSAVIRLDPQNAAAFNDRGLAYRAWGRHRRAIAEFDQALRLDPHQAGTYLNRGLCHHARGEFDRAVADFDAAIRLDPGLARAYYDRGNAHLVRGDFEQAIADYSAAIRLDPANASAYNNRGLAHRKRGAYDQAIADLDAALRLDPTNARAYDNRGQAHAGRRDYDRAIADYTAALRRDPDNVQTYRHRADAYARQGLWEQADADRRAAERLAPEAPRDVGS